MPMLNPQFQRNVATYAVIFLIVSSGMWWAASTPVVFAIIVAFSVTCLNVAGDTYHKSSAELTKARTNTKKRK